MAHRLGDPNHLGAEGSFASSAIILITFAVGIASRNCRGSLPTSTYPHGGSWRFDLPSGGTVCGQPATLEPCLPADSLLGNSTHQNRSPVIEFVRYFANYRRESGNKQEYSTTPFLPLSVRDMHRALAVLLLLTTLWGNTACSHRQQLRKEASLREELSVLRGEIGQFTLDHRRAPTSLSEVVSSGYIKQIPPDPFTGRNDTWRIEKSGDSFEVHSGSDAVSSGGTRYSSW